MNCPYCGKEMQKGEVQSGDLLRNLLKRGEPALWVPQEESGKMIPKDGVPLNVIGEGYYCENCGKVVGIFEERGADFWQ